MHDSGFVGVLGNILFGSLGDCLGSKPPAFLHPVRNSIPILLFPPAITFCIVKLPNLRVYANNDVSLQLAVSTFNQ